MIVTSWYRFDDSSKGFVYNHVSEGYSSRSQPAPVSEKQRKAWDNVRWKAVRSQKTNGVVTEL